MARPHFITALDIGSSQVKGVVAERRSEHVFAVVSTFKHPSSGFKKGVLVDVEDATHMLRDVSEELRHISKEATRNVFVNINSEQTKARTSRGITAVARGDQEIQQEDIDRVLQASLSMKSFQNYQVLHNITLEYFVDEVGDIQDPLHMTGNRLEVSTLVIETFAPQLNTLVKALERVSLDVEGLVFNPIASGRAVTTKQQRDLGVLVIDIGYSTTSLLVYIDNKIFTTKTIPIGSSHITNDLAIGLKVSVEVAEKLKLTYGCASSRDVSRRDVIQIAEYDSEHKAEVSRRFLCEIIEVRLVELFQIIHNELKVGFSKGLQLPGGVVMTGGGVKMPGFIDLVRQEMRLSVQVGVPSMKEFEIMNPGHQEMFFDPEMAVAAGLVLFGGDDEAKGFSVREFFTRFFKNLIP